MKHPSLGCVCVLGTKHFSFVLWREGLTSYAWLADTSQYVTLDYTAALLCFFLISWCGWWDLISPASINGRVKIEKKEERIIQQGLHTIISYADQCVMRLMWIKTDQCNAMQTGDDSHHHTKVEGLIQKPTQCKSSVSFRYCFHWLLDLLWVKGLNLLHVWLCCITEST